MYSVYIDVRWLQFSWASQMGIKFILCSLYDRCKCLEFCLDQVIAVEILEHCTIQLHFVTSTPSTHPIPRSPFTSSRSLIHLISKSQHYYYYYNAYNVTQKNTHSTNSLHLFQISESTNWNIHFKIMWLIMHFTNLQFYDGTLSYSSVSTIHRCINVLWYFSHDSYRDTVCKNRNTRDLATFLRFLFECRTKMKYKTANFSL